MPAYDSILRDHIDANACHVIAQAVDPCSRGWMLSCQRLIPSAFHSPPRPDFHTYPKLWNPLIFPTPPLPPLPTYLFWPKQEWCKLQKRGRCHSQTPMWWGGSLVCIFSSVLSPYLLKVSAILALFLPYLACKSSVFCPSFLSLPPSLASLDFSLFSAAFRFLAVRCVSRMCSASGLMGI